MKLPVLVLSTALLCSTGAFAQSNTTTTAPDNGTAATQTTGTTTAQPMYNGTPRDTGGNGGYGLWGLLGLFGFFGLARGGRRRDDLTTRTGTIPTR